MILNIVKANYIENYKVELQFNTGDVKIVNLKNSIFNDTRKIFEPLRDIRYFKKFKIKFNTITWPNEVDFAPEYLYNLTDSIKEETTVQHGV